MAKFVYSLINQRLMGLKQLYLYRNFPPFLYHRRSDKMLIIKCILIP